MEAPWEHLGSTPGFLYISYSVVDDQQHKKNPRLA